MFTTDLLEQDKKVILIGIVAVTAIGWMYMFYMAWAMENMHLIDMWMPPEGGTRSWTAWDFFMLFFMFLRKLATLSKDGFLMFVFLCLVCLSCL